MTNPDQRADSPWIKAARADSERRREKMLAEMAEHQGRDIEELRRLSDYELWSMKHESEPDKRTARPGFIASSGGIAKFLDRLSEEDPDQ